MLPKFVIAFLPRSKCLLISWLQSPSTVILEPKKIKSVPVSIISPFVCHDMMGPDTEVLVFWILNFKPTFSFSSFTFIKRLFSSSSLSTIRMVSFACLRLLIFLPAVLIPGCDSSTPTFRVVYSAYSPVAQTVKDPPAIQETWVWSLGQEDPLEKEMVTDSGILAWNNPMDGGA